ncbi:LysE family translocator [Pelagibius litoralis]|uniref:LysE family translocator n=1 Tax=Pelagibius litoralis TaxID=374515 RepID=A0A967C8A8_9PROT|nr:LysE family translocator [Pelagibius litoralis]NIA68272.1 LysE family translocator [Pelagibius litoralis]
MTLDLVLAFVGVAFHASIAPGPSNFLLLASGANFGLRRSLPLFLGISLGFLIVILVFGLGFERVFGAPPAVFITLKVICAGYVLWLAWKVARSAVPEGDAGTPAARPISFLQALGFQMVNPAAWLVGFIIVVSYAAGESSGDSIVSRVLLLTAVFGAVNLPSIGLWVMLGMGLRRLLGDAGKLRIFNIVIALLLVVWMVPSLLGAVF